MNNPLPGINNSVQHKNLGENVKASYSLSKVLNYKCIWSFTIASTQSSRVSYVALFYHTIINNI